MDTTLPAPVRTYITAVNDVRREFSGPNAIRAWLDREIIGEKVTMKVTRCRTDHAVVIVDAEMDGDYNKDGLPDPLVLTRYSTLAGDHIAQLIIIANQPTPSWAQP